ncbi:hypothetical protein MTR67_022956 [Solanum verrucosum]|uniref:Uncharacterized protein n=1 Tax=Solanum verrucosum TaxID=315347 RepID=A0AAF0TRD9_SOLVR|nr:hypothetical protein MTR67_022956 [Solanum verrucosum]
MAMNNSTQGLHDTTPLKDAQFIKFMKNFERRRKGPEVSGAAVAYRARHQLIEAGLRHRELAPQAQQGRAVLATF